MSISINVTATPAAPDDPLVFEVLSTGSIDGVTAQVTDPGGGTEVAYDNGDVAGYTTTAEAITGGLRITTRRLFGWWLGGVSVEVHAGASGGNKLLPNVANTEAHWPLQGDRGDISDNALGNLTTLDTYTSTAGGTEQYDVLDDCLSGFKFDGNTKLLAPAFAGLRLGGDFTVQFMMKQAGGGVNECYFSSVDPAGRSGGAAPDRIGSLATFFWGHQLTGDHPYITDMGKGSSIGGVNYWAAVDADWETTAHAIAVVRRAGVYELWIDGILKATGDGNPITANATVAGTERFYIGGCEGPGQSPINTMVADYRVLSVARVGSDLYADSLISLASCSSQSASATEAFTVGPTPGDLVDQARSRVIIQYREARKLNATIDVHASIVQQIVNCALSLPLLDDPDLAGGVNLDVDGEIVGQGRVLSNGDVATDGQYRVLIRAKGARNVAHVSSAEYVDLLHGLFAARIVLTDNGGMQILYLVARAPTADEIAALNEDIVPRPMGVKVTRSFSAGSGYFGWAGDPNARGFSEISDGGTTGGFWTELF